MKPARDAPSPRDQHGDDNAANRDEAQSEGDHAASSSKTRPPLVLAVGAHVERDLDGLWFAATIVRCDSDGTFEIEYDDEHNRETAISREELRAFDASAPRPHLVTLRDEPEEIGPNDSLLFQTSDYDPMKAPTVVLHHRGESNEDAASAYIINGLENNIAAGNGLRGIRWLRVNPT